LSGRRDQSAQRHGAGSSVRCPRLVRSVVGGTRLGALRPDGGGGAAADRARAGAGVAGGGVSRQLAAVSQPLSRYRPAQPPAPAAGFGELQLDALGVELSRRYPERSAAAT